jgi:predicted phosphate transport protein (TIGR00153 family)
MSRGVPDVLKRAGRAPDHAELLALYERAGANVETATALLHHLVEVWPDEGGERHRLVDLEHEGDRITHDIIHALHGRAATPYDTADLLELASRLDDVVDLTEEVGDFLALYNVEASMDQAVELAAVLREAGRELAAALRTLDRPAELTPHVVAIDRLEDDGDRLEREALRALFDGGIDPMVVVRWKDIFERLEQAIDACDDVAHVLEGIAVKNR